MQWRRRWCSTWAKHSRPFWQPSWNIKRHTHTIPEPSEWMPLNGTKNQNSVQSGRAGVQAPRWSIWLGTQKMRFLNKPCLANHPFIHSFGQPCSQSTIQINPSWRTNLSVIIKLFFVSKCTTMVWQTRGNSHSIGPSQSKYDVAASHRIGWVHLNTHNHYGGEHRHKDKAEHVAQHNDIERPPWLPTNRHRHYVHACVCSRRSEPTDKLVVNNHCPLLGEWSVDHQSTIDIGDYTHHHGRNSRPQKEVLATNSKQLQ